MRRLDEALRERYSLAAEAQASSPRYAALVRPRSATLAEVRAELVDSDTLLLEYALLPERSYLWVVGADGLRTFVLPGRARIEAAVSRLRRRWLTDPGAASPTEDLAELVLGPAAGLLGRKRLAVVADGALQAVPFGALTLPGARQPLLARHEIVSLPSASVLVALRRDLRSRPRAARLLAVFADAVYDASDARVSGPGEVAAPRGGDPAEERPRFYRLRATRREAQAILALAPSARSSLALDFDASRERATSPELATYRYLHFAAHGYVDLRHPELSGVVLSMVGPDGAPRDGILRLYQIAGLRLGADLVVLSACETALGEDVAGEGLASLARGFLHAGAPRVVGSLWPVPELATVELMRRFYEALFRGGVPPAAALRRAQLAVRADPRWVSPYYWAGFVLQGEWR
jgi:CHAT domain-containing protein